MHRAPKSVLVLRFSAAGDVVLTAPALATLRQAWPSTRIVFAVKHAFAGLLQANPYVDEVVALSPGEGVLSFGKRLQALAPEAILDLHDKARSRALAMLLSRSRRVVWHKRSWREELPVRWGLKPYRAKLPIIARYHAAVEELVGAQLPAAELRYFVAAQTQQEADALLTAAGVDLDRPILGMAPGANWATKMWPQERFAALAKLALGSGMQVVLTGSAAEQGITRDIASLAPSAWDMAGRVSLTALGGLITRCSAFVANDSGPMHIARALGVPTLAIFGSTDPGQFDFAGHGLLFAGVSCAPCHFYGRKRCPRGHFACMQELSVDAAWKALQPLLAAGRRPLLYA